MKRIRPFELKVFVTITLGLGIGSELDHSFQNPNILNVIIAVMFIITTVIITHDYDS